MSAGEIRAGLTGEIERTVEARCGETVRLLQRPVRTASVTGSEGALQEGILEGALADLLELRVERVYATEEQVAPYREHVGEQEGLGGKALGRRVLGAHGPLRAHSGGSGGPRPRHQEARNPRLPPRWRFVGPEDQAWVIEKLRERGLDPADKETEGWYHVDFYLARPAEEADVPLQTLLAPALG